MVAAAMTALIPGAGPPPTRIARVFMALGSMLLARSKVGEQTAGADEPEHELHAKGRVARELLLVARLLDDAVERQRGARVVAAPSMVRFQGRGDEHGRHEDEDRGTTGDHRGLQDAEPF